ncbi:hypothetical protein [Armatimonas sp.]|uniref:hypothetical protein n=1 Tax=Armatimonas sp. TaxID=1872638 RepID=UPI003753303A
MSDAKNILIYLKAKFAGWGGVGCQVGIANLALMSPVLMGSFSELARAGDSMSLPIHYCIAILVFVMIWASLEFSATIGVVAMFVYLVLLGAIRRGLIPSTGYISNDPITLVSVLVGGVFFLRMVLMRKIPRHTPVARLISVLIILMILEIFNPLQGGIAVGIGGAVFKLTPLFWYYVGINKGSRSVAKKVFIVFIILGIFETFIGLRQTAGLTEVEKFWTLVNRGATQAVSRDVFRSFGTLLSFSEYVTILNMGVALCWVAILRRRYVYLIPFTILAGALVLSSSRGGVINLFLMMVVVWAVQAKSYRAWIPRLVVAIVIAFWGLTLGIEKAKEIDVDDRTAVLLNHQIRGLSDPLGSNSTGGSHISLIGNGILRGFLTPTGMGLGTGTIAATKFGTGQTATEADFSDMFVSLGFIGGILYILICFRICVTIGRYWHDARDYIALSVIALMTVCQGNWLAGAHYSQSMILWFLIGTMDRVNWQYRQSIAKELVLPARKLELPELSSRLIDNASV